MKRQVIVSIGQNGLRGKQRMIHMTSDFGTISVRIIREPMMRFAENCHCTKRKENPGSRKTCLTIVLKHAAANLFRWIVEHGYFGKILFCVFVHDEIDCECPKEIADSFAKMMEKIMEKAAATFYKKLAIPAECSVGPYWIH